MNECPHSFICSVYECATTTYPAAARCPPPLSLLVEFERLFFENRWNMTLDLQLEKWKCLKVVRLQNSCAGCQGRNAANCCAMDDASDSLCFKRASSKQLNLWCVRELCRAK